MKSLWNDAEAGNFNANPLNLRVYTSRLLGRDTSLVLHGGGNTSVKIKQKNIFGDNEHLLYVKGSGWDLATIEEKGFAPVKMDLLMRLAKLETLSDTDMVREQKAAMTNPGAPAPSVEAILHAMIPFQYVDHTHADAVVAISNTPHGPDLIKEIYGSRVILIPYVMPGFILARKVYELTRDIDWKKYEGMILLHHGVFSFADDARESYERMIKLVSLAEDYLKSKKAFEIKNSQAMATTVDPLTIAKLRRSISKELKTPAIAKLNTSPQAISFSNLPHITTIATRGPLTPDHVIHTKQIPLVISEDVATDVATFTKNYTDYFHRNNTGTLTCLDIAPRWAVWPGHGTLSFGPTAQRTQVVEDIIDHTMTAIQWAEALGGWKALPEKDIFEVEYWELEQAKLKKAGSTPQFQGKIALVTGAASGIGKTCVEMLKAQGAAVAILDINPKIHEIFKGPDLLPIVCDVTKSAAINEAVTKVIRHFGGLDILVTNAGSFPPGKNITDLDDELWNRSLELNLTSHHYIIRACAPFLALGFDPAIVVIASKNVPAPGPGAAAYSTAKAGLTQLARVAALELGPLGIRVNILHPHAVFDTGIWTDEVLASRAKHYGMTIEEYKKNNILKVEVTSKDVGNLVCAMAGHIFAKTTGAQVAIDGGNDRVI